MSTDAPQPVITQVPDQEEQLALRQIVAAAVAFALAAASFLHFGVTARGFISALFVIVLTALAAIDIEQRILPNRIVLPATLVILMLQIAFFPHHTVEWILSSLGAGLFFLIAYLVQRTGLGQGDVKFALLLGAGLGKAVVLGIFVGMFAAGVGGLLIIAREGLAARKKMIPLGPFLAVGAVVSLFFSGSDFVSF
jgi:prepilin signal peptidase PulO-like enzyme (type II secretory pathway)